jgi:hypothetical protein
MTISSWSLAFLCSQIVLQLLWCFHFIVPSGKIIYFVLYFHHQVSCSVIPSLMLDHSYVRKAIKVKILWHHNGSFGSLLGHSVYFFKGPMPSFNGLTCCPCLFRMLGFDRSCTSFSFPTRWSPYSIWCNGTCKDRYLTLLVALWDTRAMLLLFDHMFCLSKV